MAKPSVTNIKAPAPTFTSPSKTFWDLDNPLHITAAGGDYILNSGSTVAAFGSKTATINTSEPSGVLAQSDYQDYDYVFFGVNGGENETVKGTTDLSGIIVTGNGKDNITGGNEADLIITGNGNDIVNAGGGNDIVFGENGADKINGGADEGSANYVEADDGQVTEDGEAVFVWDINPNGNTTYDLSQGDQAGQLRKEGIFIEGTDDVHHVFSFVATQTGDYQIRLTNGVVLDDGDSPNGDSGDEPASNPFTIHVEANQKYYFSFEDDDGGQVEVYLASTSVPDPNQGQNHVNPITQQGYGAESTFDFPDGGNGTRDFEAGDQLIGGTGPDQFIWNAADVNNVDLIWDYNQGNGGAVDDTEGDTLLLIGVTAGGFTTFMKDLDGDAVDDLVIYVGENKAIGLVGITDISQVNLQFG